MKKSHLFAMTATALLVTGSAFAGPDCKKNCPKDGSEEGVYEVAEREGGEAREGKREKGEKAKGDRKGRDHSPLRGLDMTEDQKESAKEIMTAAREEAKEVMAGVKAKKEAGEEVDREAVRAQMMTIRKSAMDSVYKNVLNDDQRAKVDERRKKMEERRAEREANGGERPERKSKGDRKGKGEGKGDKKDKGGDDGLDL